MPLDPTIANPAMIKLADPSEQYGNALKNAYLMNQIAEAKQKRDDTTAMRDAWSAPGADGPDRIGVLTNSLIKAKRGDLVQPLLKSQAEIDKVNAEAGNTKASMNKSKVEAYAKALDNAKTRYEGVSADPEVAQHQLYSIFQEEAKDPTLAEFFKDRGRDHVSSEVNDLQKAMQNPDAFRQYLNEKKLGSKAAAEQLKNKVMELDLGGTKKVVSVNEYTPGAPKTLGDYKVTESPNKASTNIVLNNVKNAEGTFSKALGKDVEARYNSLGTIAHGAQSSVQNIDHMIDLVHQGALTGKFSDFQANMLQVAKGMGFNVDDKAIVNSQELRKMLAQNIYAQVAQMKASGVPLSRLTNMELELVKQGSPSAEMDEKTIRRLLSAQRKMIQNSVEQYNQMNDDLSNSPGLEPTLKAMASHKVDNIQGRTIPEAAIQFLKKHPETKAKFEDTFDLDPGSADRIIKGGSPNGQAPF